MKNQINIKSILLSVLMVSLALISFSACGNKEEKVEILGAGATFPYPLYSKMFDEYFKLNTTKVNYQSIGSGGGIKQLINKTVDFGATDAFMSDKELEEAKSPIIHIPTAMGAVAVIYNLPNIKGLQLDANLITKLYNGEIKTWNDPKIKELNPNLNLPNTKVLVVGRSDGSGTTFVFSDFLSKASEEWNKLLGKGKTIKWPTGIAGKGNAGVAGMVKQTPGAIGYVELEYALSNKIEIASIKNKAGNFIVPSIESVTTAANVEIPADTRISIANTEAAQGYPISTFTWVIMFKEQNYNNRKEAQANALVKLASWMITDGQKFHSALNYAPLPSNVVLKSKALLETVTWNNKSLLKQ